MTTRKDDLGREAGPEKTAPIKYSNSACLVMEFDTYEEALAFATRVGGEVVEYDADLADLWDDYYDFDPFR